VIGVPYFGYVGIMDKKDHGEDIWGFHDMCAPVNITS
jgi:hypothetical protein